ncbi:transglutaminaseTgpA domain-containing protein [Streptomyces sp. NPDC093261]|uniref:transglutaminaseTgpA domain-containing protein n=1 Tax=Streptomyces sp. NPDC093261 TaxID=3366037 RepID=UPI003802D5EA
MSGRARLALCAAAATLAASCALLPLVSPMTWLFEAAFLVAVQTGVGALARRVPLARPLTIACQAVVGLLLLTLIFAHGQAIAGFLPGPDAFRRFGELLRSGTQDVGQYATPAPLTPGIRLMVVGGVLLIGLLVDALAVTFRAAAPAGLPLLALYSVAAGLSDGAADWLWFLIAASGYLTLLLAEGRDRLSQWGRVFAGAARGRDRDSGGTVAPVRTGRRIGAVALGVALVVPLALPSLRNGLLDGTGTGVGAGFGNGNTISAVNPLVSLRDSLNVDQDRQVMAYRTNTDDTQDMYLRIVALDDFDGTTWRPAQRHITAVPDALPTPAGLAGGVRRTEIETRISAADWYAQDWLPMPYPATSVKIKGSWRFEPVGRTLVGDHGQSTRGLQYDVKSLIVQPTAEQLATAPEPSDALKREFTRVPASLPAVVGQTARKVTAGSTNHYEQAVRLQDYFSVDGGFSYNTDVQVGTGPGAIARFLKSKQGFCVHFSFAMAAMARTLGIPARVAVGFTPGSPQADGSMSVGLRDAHAWPELYFEGVGWTRFEPTPNRGTTPSYTQADTPSGENPLPPRPSLSSTTAPSTGPSASESCSAAMHKLEACPNQSSGAVAVAGDSGPPWYQVAGWTLLGLALIAVPLTPMLWRLRSRSVRLASARHASSGLLPVGAGRTPGAGEQYAGDVEVALLPGEGPPGRAAEVAVGHTLAVWRELTDTAWDYGIVPDDALTPRGAAERIVRLGRLDGPAAAAVHRVAGAVEQVLFAPQPRSEAGLVDDVRGVRAALRSRISLRSRVRAVVAPRSALRVVWAVGDRWADLKTRWTTRLSALLRRPSGQESG